MSDGIVRKWVTKFKEGRDNMHDKPRSGWPSVVSSQLDTFYKKGIQKLVPHYNKCLNDGGNYADK
jgi:transposase